MKSIKLIIESNRTLIESNRTLIESNRTFIESNRTLIESNRTLIESNRTLIESNRTLIEYNILPKKLKQLCLNKTTFNLEPIIKKLGTNTIIEHLEVYRSSLNIKEIYALATVICENKNSHLFKTHDAAKGNEGKEKIISLNLTNNNSMPVEELYNIIKTSLD
ncbi:12334_t:CDS:2 [Gigaspora margarita]|uniref:12334_t:CDS:1 n=1 Tax=Gigaspora margarita TaxID=4874 RepID=A0ABM8W1L8_GIGMA|nr:12334_t:CDS:2 [Gigaspora margarita]